ncbi:MAG: hypothetical protein R3E89_11615 [Thiolinea sp.]
MVGYAAALISYPLEMTRWAQPVSFSFGHIGSLTDSLHRVFGTVSTAQWDAATGATALDAVKVNLGLGSTRMTSISRICSPCSVARAGTG